MLKRIILLAILLPLGAFAAGKQVLDKVVAQINDDVITESELTREMGLVKNQLQARQMQIPEENVLRKQVLQHMIDINLQLQLAKNNGLNIDTAEVDDGIEKIAKTNNMEVAQLRKIIEQGGMPWEDYKENIRKEMVITRLQQNAIGSTVNVSNEQVDDYMQTAKEDNRKQGTFTLQNIVIPLSEAPTPEELAKAQSKAKSLLAKIKAGADFSQIAVTESSGEFALVGGDLGERHLAELPELFAKEVLKMKVGQVSGPLRAANGFQLIKLVAVGGSANDHHEVTQTHARHILIKSNNSTSAQDAERQAMNIYQQLQSGKDFALMAKQYSLDGASAVKGGDLGWVNPGEVVPEFEQTMDKLPVNGISKPVKSRFGWHIIQVLGRKTVDDSLVYQKQKVRQFLHQRKFAEAVQSWQQHLRADAFIQVLDKGLA